MDGNCRALRSLSSPDGSRIYLNEGMVGADRHGVFLPGCLEYEYATALSCRHRRDPLRAASCFDPRLRCAAGPETLFSPGDFYLERAYGEPALFPSPLRLNAAQLRQYG